MRQSSWMYPAKFIAVNFESGWPERRVAPDGSPAKKSSTPVEQEPVAGGTQAKAAWGRCAPLKSNRPRPLLKTCASASRCANSPPIFMECLPFRMETESWKSEYGLGVKYCGRLKAVPMTGVPPRPKGFMVILGKPPANGFVTPVLRPYVLALTPTSALMNLNVTRSWPKRISFTTLELGV